MKYKKGDRVRLISKPTKYTTTGVEKYLGKVVTISGMGTSIFSTVYYTIEEDDDYIHYFEGTIAGLASEVPFDFDAWKGKDVCMHCKTKEEAEDFRKVMNKAGLRWSSGSSYLLWSCFEPYGEQTCYCFNKGTYESTVRAKDKGYTILEWSDYRSTEPKGEQEKTMETKIDDKPLSYQEAMRIFKKLCKNEEKFGCLERKCPLYHPYRDELHLTCFYALHEYSDEIEPILKKWLAEHPVKTNEQKCNEMFLEVFGMQYATALMHPDWWQQEYVEPYKTNE